MVAMAVLETGVGVISAAAGNGALRRQLRRPAGWLVRGSALPACDGSESHLDQRPGVVRGAVTVSSAKRGRDDKGSGGETACGL